MLSIWEVRERLKTYRAQDNDDGLKVLITIFNEPSIALNDLANILNLFLVWNVHDATKFKEDGLGLYRRG